MPRCSIPVIMISGAFSLRVSKGVFSERVFSLLSDVPDRFSVFKGTAESTSPIPLTSESTIPR